MPRPSRGGAPSSCRANRDPSPSHIARRHAASTPLGQRCCVERQSLFRPQRTGSGIWPVPRPESPSLRGASVNDFKEASRDATLSSAWSASGIRPTDELRGAITGRVWRKGAIAAMKSKNGPSPHQGRMPAPSMIKRSTRSAWRASRVCATAPPSEMPTTCARPAGTRSLMRVATSAATSMLEVHGSCLLMPQPGKSGARQWNAESLAMWFAHMRPLRPAPVKEHHAGSTRLAGLSHVHSSGSVLTHTKAGFRQVLA